jgi:methyl-accepting chemotaxis protein
MQSQSQLFAEVFLMDLSGRAVLSTNLDEEGKIHINQIYFREGLERPYFSTPFYSPSLAQLSVVAVRPVLNSQGRSIGVIAGRASMDKLSQIMSESAGLGETGETYLVGPNHGLLTSAKDRVVTQDSAVYVRNEGVNRAISEEVKLNGLYEDFRGVPVVGVYYWYPELQVTLVAEQDQAEAFNAIYTILGINFSVAAIAVVVAIMVSLVVTRSIATPLTRLGQAAVAVEREEFDPDQLHLEDVMQRGDELGQLARVFQRMAREVYTRVQRLKQEVMQLQIVIDESKREKQVSELTETDFFRDLSVKAKDMRRQRKTRQEEGE